MYFFSNVCNVFSWNWDLSQRAVIWAHTSHFIFDTSKVTGILYPAAVKSCARIRRLLSVLYFHRGFLLLLSLSSPPLALSQLNNPVAVLMGCSLWLLGEGMLRGWGTPCAASARLGQLLGCTSV